MIKKHFFLWLIPAVIAVGILMAYILIVFNKPIEVPLKQAVETPVEKPIETPVEMTEKAQKDSIIEKPIEEPVQDRGPKELYKIQAENVLSLEFISENEKLSFVKQGLKWSVNNDNYNRIDQQKVISTVENILSLDSLETISFNTSEPEKWGIRQSSQIIKIHTSNGLITLFPGSVNPSQTGYYLQIKGKDEIYLVKDSFGETLKLNLDDLRDRNLILFEKSGIETLSIQNEKQIRIIPYKKYDQFTADKFSYMLEAPYNAYIPVSKEGLSTFLNTLSPSIQIVDFIDEGLPEDFGIDENSSRLTVKEKDGRSFELLLGTVTDSSKIFGKVTGEKQIFTLNRTDLSFLDLKPFDLVEKLPHLISMESIDTFMITNDDLAVIATIERRGDRQMYAVNGMETEEKSFNALYEKIQELTLSGESRQIVNMEKPEIIISYKLYDGGSLWTHLNFFSYDDKHLAVARNEEEALFIIERTQLNEMLKEITTTVDKIMGF